MLSDPIKMERPIKSEPASQTSYLRSPTSIAPSAMPGSHPIQQLEQVIMEAEAADPSGRARDLLRPIQETIKVREQHYEDCLKEKDAQVLALKLELSKAKLGAKELDEYFQAVRSELRDTKGEIRSLRSQVREDEKRIRQLEAEKLACVEENNENCKKMEATRADLEAEVDTLRGTITGQDEELFDLRVEDITQRGEIHFLKKDIEALQRDLESNRAAADWLAHNGPSLQENFHKMKDEITELKAKGAEMARLMAKGAREWESDVVRPDSGVLGPGASGALAGYPSSNARNPQLREPKRYGEMGAEGEPMVGLWASKEHRRAMNSPQAKRSRNGQVKQGYEFADPYVGMDVGKELEIVQHRRKRMSLLQ